MACHVETQARGGVVITVGASPPSQPKRWDTWEHALEQQWLLVMLLLFGLTLSVRLLYGLVLFPKIQGQPVGHPSLPAGNDPYDDIAQNVLAGNGYVSEVGGQPYLRRGPGYVGYLIVVRAVLGMSAGAVIVAHALTGGVSTVILALLGRRVTGRPIVGAIAGLAFSLYPEAIRQVAAAATEPWFTLLLLGLTWVLLRLFERSSWHQAVVSGGLIALISLTRPVFQFFPVFLLSFALLRHRSALWSALRYQAVLWLAFALVVTPWTVRNYAVTGQFIPITTQGPSDLFLGTQINYGLDFGATREAAIQMRGQVIQEVVSKGGDNIDSERRFLSLALNQIRAKPLEYLKEVLLRMLGFWYLTETRLGIIKNLVEHVPIYALAILGLIRLRWLRWRVLVLLLPVLYLNAAHGLTHAMLRYALPVMPIVFLFAATGVLELQAYTSRCKERAQE